MSPHDWLLLRWFPVRDQRTLLPWLGCLFGSGLIGSVRLALLEGPGMLLLTLAVVAVERQRSRLGVGLVALAGLGRETNLLGCGVFVEQVPGTRWQVVRLAGALVFVALPLLAWQAYLWSLSPAYASATELGYANFAPPLAAYARK